MPRERPAGSTRRPLQDVHRAGGSCPRIAEWKQVQRERIVLVTVVFDVRNGALRRDMQEAGRRSPYCRNVRILRPSSEDEMVALFLRAELPSERYGPAIERALVNAAADRRVVGEPDLSDPGENAARRRLLSEVRDYGGAGLFNGFPSDVRWKWAALTPEELMAVRFIDYDYWVELSGGTRAFLRRQREGFAKGSRPLACQTQVSLS